MAEGELRRAVEARHEGAHAGAVGVVEAVNAGAVDRLRPPSSAATRLISLCRSMTRRCSVSPSLAPRRAESATSAWATRSSAKAGKAASAAATRARSAAARRGVGGLDRRQHRGEVVGEAGRQARRRRARRTTPRRWRARSDDRRGERGDRRARRRASSRSIDGAARPGSAAWAEASCNNVSRIFSRSLAVSAVFDQRREQHGAFAEPFDNFDFRDHGAPSQRPRRSLSLIAIQPRRIPAAPHGRRALSTLALLRPAL